jgi:hypothetical protein
MRKLLFFGLASATVFSALGQKTQVVQGTRETTITYSNKNKAGGGDPGKSAMYPSGFEQGPDFDWLYQPGGPLDAFDRNSEILDLRDAYTKHYKNPDGKITAMITAGPQHYLQDGLWHTIINNIKSTGNALYPNANLTNDYKTYYGSTPAAGIRFETPESRFVFKNPKLAYLSADLQVLGEVELTDFSNTNVNRETLVYQNVAPAIDFQVEQTSAGFRTSYILNQLPSDIPSQAAYIGVMEEMEYPQQWQLDNNQGWAAISNPSGEGYLKISSINAFEKSNEYGTTQKGHIQLYESGKMVFYFPLEWVTAPERNFPVVLDPTVTYTPNPAVYWTGTVEEDSGCDFATDNDSDENMRIGFDDGTFDNDYYQCYARFNISAIPDNACIQSGFTRTFQYNFKNDRNDDNFLEFYYQYLDPPNFDPIPATCDAIFNNINNTPSYYTFYNVWGSTCTGPVSCTDYDETNNAWKDWIGNTGPRVQSLLAQDWVVFSWDNIDFNHIDPAWQSNDEWLDYRGWNNANRPQLVVTYETPFIAATSASVSPNNVCPGTNITLTQNGGTNGSVGAWFWYSGSCGGTLVGSTPAVNGAVTIPAPPVPTTYFVRGQNICGNTICQSVVFTPLTTSTAPTAISATVNPVCQGGSTQLSVSGGSLGSGAQWQWYTGSCGGTPAGTGTSVTVSPSLSTTYFVRAEGTCNTSACASLVVNVSSPTVGGSTAVVPSTVCVGSTVGLTLSGQNGAVVGWQMNLNGGGWNSIGGAGLTSITSPALGTAGTYDFRAVVQNSPCASQFSSASTVTVNGLSVGGTAAPAISPVCLGGNTTVSLSGSTGSVVTWERRINGGGWVNIGNAGLTTIPTGVLNTVGTWEFRATVQNAPCAPVYSTTAVIQVSPLSVGGAASALSTQLCNGGATTISLSGETGTVLYWELQINGGGFNNIGNAGLTSISTGALAPGTYDYRAVVQSAPCASATSSSVSVTVSTASVGGSAIPSVGQLCQGGNTNITLTGNNGTVLYWEQRINGGSWVNIGSAGLSLINSGALGAGLNEFRAVVQSGGCPSANSATAAVNVDSTSVGGSVSSNFISVCDGSPVMLTLAGNTGVITQWERQYNGGGWISVGNAGVNPFTTVPLTPSGNYDFRALVTSGLCAPAYSASVSVSVNPNDDPTFSYSSSVFCQGGANVAPTVTTGGGTFSASPAGLAINPSNGIIDLSASAPGLYTVTYTTSGICSASATQTINISSSPNTSFSYTSLSYCLNAPSNPVPTVTSPGGTFTSLNPGLLFVNSITGEINLSVSQPGSYFVQYSIGGSCPSSSIQTVILLAPGNSSFTYASPSYCLGSGTAEPVVGAFGGTFSASPFGIVFANVATGAIDLGTSSPGTYTITYNSGGPCPTTTNQTVTLNLPASPLFFYSSSTFCKSGTNPTPFVSSPGGGFTSSPAGLIFVNPATGEISLAASQPGSYLVTYSTGGLCPTSYSQYITILSNQNATFVYPQNSYCQNGVNPTPTVAQIGGVFTSTPGLVFANVYTGQIDLAASTPGTYTITYTVPGTCIGVYTQNITINSGAVGSLSYAASGFCTGGANAPATVTPGGGTFTSSPAGLFFADAIGTIDVAGSVPGAYTITYTPPGSCVTPASVNVSIINTPQPLIQPVGNLCTNSPALTINGSPAGGTWSGGAFISPSGVFDPSVSGAGSFVVTYSVTGPGGCVGTANTTIVVNPAPSVNIAAAGPYCSNDGIQTLSATPLGGTWSGNPFVSINGLFFPSNSGAGIFPVQYTVNTGGCTGSSIISIVVFDAPQPQINPVAPICANASPVGLSATVPGGIWSGGAYVTSNGTFNPALASLGNNTVTYTLVSGACSVSVSSQVSVSGVPNVQLSTPSPFCSNDPPQYILANMPGGVFVGGNYINGSGLFDPGLASQGNNMVIYSLVGNNGCVGSDTIQVVVNSNPDATITYPGTVCQDAPPFALTAATGGGVWSGGVYVNSGIFDPSVAGVGSHAVAYNVSSGQGCSSTSSIFITVEPKPISFYDHQPNGLTVYFTDLSQFADTYLWNFGDGSPEVTDQNPVHVFPDNGVYLVRLIAYNECGSDTLIRSVAVNKATSIDENGSSVQVQLFPNPADQFVNLTGSQIAPGIWTIRMNDMSGKEVMLERFSVETGELNKTIDVTALNPGIYFIRLSDGNVSATLKFIKF